ncbi:hypothetical protein [Streptomyces sp. NPDC048350]|uniref:hypothetical protein n=1 Tax=Streptomyces sp. NPDC048350 TaxID=3365538 RepID=UPI00371CA205
MGSGQPSGLGIDGLSDVADGQGRVDRDAVPRSAIMLAAEEEASSRAGPTMCDARL